MLKAFSRKITVTGYIESIQADLETRRDALQGGPSAEFLKGETKEERIRLLNQHIINLDKIRKYQNDVFEEQVKLNKEENGT